MSRAPSEVIDAIVQDHIKPALHRRGFRKKASVFWRDQGEIVDVVTVQKSQWNDRDSASFTVNLGLYWKRVQELIGRTVARTPRAHDCTVSERLGPLFDEGRDYWWNVTSASDASVIGPEVVTKLIDHGIPWLESGHSLQQTLEYAEKRNHKLARDAIVTLLRAEKN